MGLIKNKADKNFLRVTLFKAVPLFILSFFAVFFLKEKLIPHLNIEISEWWYPFILLVIASQIGKKIIYPAEQAMRKERKNQDQNKSQKE